MRRNLAPSGAFPRRRGPHWWGFVRARGAGAAAKDLDGFEGWAVTRRSMSGRLVAARNVIDQAWSIYDGSPGEAEQRGQLIGEAVQVAFPAQGVALSTADLETLDGAADDAQRGWVELVRLRRDHDARHAEEPSDDTRLAAWAARVATNQADDWIDVIDRLRRSTRRYQVVQVPEAVPVARHRATQRFARRCAAELGIATPVLSWIRPVPKGDGAPDADLVTLGDIAGCASTSTGDRTVIFVRSDIRDPDDRLRVVAHEVAHHGGADEQAARDFELTVLRRHGDVGRATDDVPDPAAVLLELRR
jgi:hypothetical protein